MIDLSIISNKFKVLGTSKRESFFTEPLYFISTDTQTYEMGMRFFSAVAGYILGIRYIKAPNDNGSHIGRIWTDAGTLLTSVTFDAPVTTNIWQEKYLDMPLAITANTAYRVSVNASNGYPYAIQDFSSAVVKGNLTAPQNAGSFILGAGSFPTSTFNNSNYFRDILFIPS